MLLAELPHVGDDYPLPLGIDEAGMGLWQAKVPSIVIVSPASMTVYPAVCDGYHVGLIESTLTAKSSKIGHWTSRSAIGIDKATVGLHVFASARAVAMRPALVRFQFGLPGRKPHHRRVVQSVLAAKRKEVHYGYILALGFDESCPFASMDRTG